MTPTAWPGTSSGSASPLSVADEPLPRRVRRFHGVIRLSDLEARLTTVERRLGVMDELIQRLLETDRVLTAQVASVRSQLGGGPPARP
jgi:hypothetical protein